MSGKPQKMKNYADFSEWYKDQSGENKKLIEKLRVIIEQTAPQLVTTVKWGQGCWVDNHTPRVFIHTEEDHVQLGFYNGTSLEDPHGLLSGNGKYVRFIKVYDSEDINSKSYSQLIEKATTGS